MIGKIKKGFFTLLLCLTLVLSNWGLGFNLAPQNSLAKAAEKENTAGLTITTSGTYGDDISHTYCTDVPTVTVTSNYPITSITVEGKEVSSNYGTSYTFTPSLTEQKSVLGDNDTYKEGTVTAKDERGNEVSIKIHVGHVLGARASVIYDATCTADGHSESVWFCRYCREAFYSGTDKESSPFAVINKATGHSFTEETITCCNGSEYTKKTCATCGFIEIYDESGKKVDADDLTSCEFNNGYTIDKEAACGQDGSKSKHCTHEGCQMVSDVETIPHKDHDYTYTWVTDNVEGSCQRASTWTYKCNTCQHTETHTNVSGHNWEPWYTVDVPATCTTNGQKSIHCADCDAKTKETEIPALGSSSHKYEWVALVPATCTSSGIQVHKCVICGETDGQEQKEIPALGHNYHWVTTIEPTCEHTGQCQYKCTRCDDVQITQTLSALDHVFDSTTGDCTTEHTCKLCGKTFPAGKHVPAADDGDCSTPVLCTVCKKELIPAKEHQFSEDWSWDGKEHYHACTNEGCDQKSDVADHSIDDDRNCTTSDPCTVCGYQTTAQTAHDVTNYFTKDDKYHYSHCMAEGCDAAWKGEHTFVTTSSGRVVCSVCHNRILPEVVEPHTHQFVSNHNGTHTCQICHEIYVHTPEADDGNCVTPTKCSGCGEILTPAQSSHHYASEWSWDGSQHYHACTNPGCNQKKDVANHSIKDDRNCTTSDPCTICGYRTQANVAHDVSNYFNADENYHYSHCMVEGCDANWKEAHTYVTTSSGEKVCSACHDRVLPEKPQQPQSTSQQPQTTQQPQSTPQQSQTTQQPQSTPQQSQAPQQSQTTAEPQTTPPATTVQPNFDEVQEIKGKCQMPYDGEGGGYLIGVESYNNPDQSYQYELLILDCTLLAQGKDAWIYTTGRCNVPSGNAFWTVWQPEYGYYWTLFRVYDSDGNLIDQECYGFANAY